MRSIHEIPALQAALKNITDSYEQWLQGEIDGYQKSQE